MKRLKERHGVLLRRSFNSFPDSRAFTVMTSWLRAVTFNSFPDSSVRCNVCHTDYDTKVFQFLSGFQWLSNLPASLAGVTQLSIPFRIPENYVTGGIDIATPITFNSFPDSRNRYSDFCWASLYSNFQFLSGFQRLRSCKRKRGAV